MKTGHLLNALLGELHKANRTVTVRMVWGGEEVLQSVRVDAGAPFLVTDGGIRIPLEIDAITVKRNYNRKPS